MARREARSFGGRRWNGGVCEPWDRTLPLLLCALVVSFAAACGSPVGRADPSAEIVDGSGGEGGTAGRCGTGTGGSGAQPGDGLGDLVLWQELRRAEETGSRVRGWRPDGGGVRTLLDGIPVDTCSVGLSPTHVAGMASDSRALRSAGSSARENGAAVPDGNPLRRVCAGACRSGRVP